jgi:hypothetical protein
MRQAIHILDIETAGRGLVEITGPVAGWTGPRPSTPAF